MKKFESKLPLERGLSADIWRKTLVQIPSVFGRMVYLSSLRNQNSGAYEHHGLALLYGEDEAGRALLASHEQSFQEWMNFPLERQKEDLDLYLSGLPERPAQIVEAWVRLAPYRHWMPGTAGSLERELFLTDLETLLGLLRNELGVAAPDPDA